MSPFGVFFLDDSNELQQKIAKKFWIKRTRNIEQISKKFAYKNNKIRIGYVSPDFRDHPMMGLIPNFLDHLIEKILKFTPTRPMINTTSLKIEN